MGRQPRIRKSDASEETQFAEEVVTAMSDRDRDRFLELLENPPAPNAALRNAMRNSREHRGS